MKISELRPGLSDVNVEGKIVGEPESREVMTKFGNQIMLTNAFMEDDSGKVKLVLWGDQANGVKEGVTVSIKNGYTKEFKGELQVGISKKGTIEVVS